MLGWLIDWIVSKEEKRTDYIYLTNHIIHFVWLNVLLIVLSFSLYFGKIVNLKITKTKSYLDR